MKKYILLPGLFIAALLTFTACESKEPAGADLQEESDERLKQPDSAEIDHTAVSDSVNRPGGMNIGGH